MKCEVCNSELNNNNCDKCNPQKNESPTKGYEKLVYVVNCIFIIVLLIMLMGLFVSSGILGLLYIISLGNVDLLNEVDKMIPLVSIAIILPMILFNIILGISMYLKNKKEIYIGKYAPINKIKYVLLACFLGIAGVHRFAIKDTEGGIKRVIFTLGIPFVLYIILLILDVNLIFFGILSIVAGYSVVLSDVVIALSKVSRDGEIYI
ncbi:MAG: TM2 domain-containing protein [Bacilli bacterium]|nr:TM2 domain-containing protein [Bacilli bacterium]